MMIFLQFYRMYAAAALGVALYFAAELPWWLCLGAVIALRAVWYFIERRIRQWHIGRDFERHVFEFKQQLGPYGIRMANRAEKEPSIKRSLAEVFTSNKALLKKNVDQLEVMDTLFRAGMRPDVDSYHLHDLKLKYGKYRLEKEEEIQGERDKRKRGME